MAKELNQCRFMKLTGENDASDASQGPFKLHSQKDCFERIQSGSIALYVSMSVTEKNKLTSKHRLIIEVNNANIASWLQSNDASKKCLLTTIQSSKNKTKFEEQSDRKKSTKECKYFNISSSVMQHFIRIKQLICWRNIHRVGRSIAGNLTASKCSRRVNLPHEFSDLLCATND